MKRSSAITAISAALVISMNLAGLTGCTSHEDTNKNNESKVSSTGKIESTNKVSSTGKVESTTEGENIVVAQKDDKPSDDTSTLQKTPATLEKYMSFLGLSKEKMLAAFEEKPGFINEAGYELKNEGLTIWFEKRPEGPVVSQILTQRSDLDFNGAKIGDNIEKFKKIFGDPYFDKGGEAHFKYKNIYLWFNYDSTSGKTTCAYFKKDKD